MKRDRASSAPLPVVGDTDALVRRHVTLGWLLLGVFVTLGAGLESLHGFKVGWYLDVGSETRRLLLTLAHAHGTLMGVLHLAFAFTVRESGALARSHSVASRCLVGASIALPGGFLLGGLTARGGDPGLAVIVVPIGAALLVVAVIAAFVASRRPS
jgi:hypothetical protein